MTTVRFWDHEYPHDFFEPLVDATHLRYQPDALQVHLAEHGYAWLRGVLPREEVLTARQRVAEHIHDCGHLDSNQPLNKLAINPLGNHGGGMLRDDITHDEKVLSVLEHENLFQLFQQVFAEDPTTFTFKWLRYVGANQTTGCHMDNVYMNRGSNRLMTAWVPMGDYQLTDGVLTIVKNSHRSEAFEKLRNTYAQIDVDREKIAGWFSRDPEEISQKFQGTWCASPVEAGDIIIFGMHLMHASTTNTSTNYRLSCDIRFQPASDPVDDRWGGPAPTGHTGMHASDATTLAQLRKQWGV